MNKKQLDQIRARAEADSLGQAWMANVKEQYRQDVLDLLKYIDELKHENNVMYQELRKANKRLCREHSND